MGERLPYRHGLSLLLTPQFSGEVCCVDASCSWLIASVLKWQGAIDVGLLQRKGCRKKLLQRLCAHAIDAHIRWLDQFLHHLTAGAAWHAGPGAASVWASCSSQPIQLDVCPDRGEESALHQMSAHNWHFPRCSRITLPHHPHGGPTGSSNRGNGRLAASCPCHSPALFSAEPTPKGCSGFVFRPNWSTAIAG